MWKLIKQATYDYFHPIQSIKSLLPPKPPAHDEDELVRKTVERFVGPYTTKKDIQQRKNKLDISSKCEKHSSDAQ